ncbi:MAG: PP2C family protein-serine/threonine phosphatase [Candidatus Aquicultorales bacterium]
MNKHLRILILEDESSDFELVQRELRKAGLDFTVEWAQDQASFIKALHDSAPDLILLDYALPGFDGRTALSLVRQRFSKTPTIIVSGKIGEEAAVELVKAGADDYVLKQRLGRLAPVVQRALEEAEARTEVAGRREAELTGARIKICILEDNEADVALIRRELKKAGIKAEIRWAYDEPTFVKEIEAAPDLILADYSLPGFDGMAALALARQRLADVPTIIVSGAIGEETAIETLKAGATDYVLKQRLNRLGPVVHRALREARELLDKKNTERMLRQTSLRLSTIIENSPLAMIEWDADFRIVRWTDEATRVFGWTADDMLGKPLDEAQLVFEEDWPKVRAVLRDMQSGKRPRVVNTNRNYAKTGQVIWCEWYSSGFYDESGRFTGYISLGLDVTEKIRVNELLRNHVNLLQQAMLPSIPGIEAGYGVASYYLPAYAEEEVGGDFYDVFETETGAIGILIGDVAGKGIEAAALAAMARSTIRAFEFELYSTAEALNHANKVLSAYTAKTQSFVTAHLMVLDPPSGRIRFTSAGHPPPAVYHADRGDVEWLKTRQDLPVRVSKTHRFHEKQALLGLGDKIVLYTDGLSEARRNGGELFGSQGIERVLSKTGGGTASDLIDELVEAARVWTGGHLRDDTAIIVVCRESEAQALDRRQAA